MLCDPPLRLLDHSYADPGGPVTAQEQPSQVVSRTDEKGTRGDICPTLRIMGT